MGSWLNNKKEIDEKQIGKNFPVFTKLHKLITKVNKKTYYFLYPIYIKYFIEDKVFATVFFKGGLVDKGGVDLGLKFETKPNIKGLRDAKYMKDPCANYSILIKDINFDTKKIRTLIKLAQKL